MGDDALGTGDHTPRMTRTSEEIDDKINELRQYNDYGRGPRADNLKYKHQGWIDALRWVLGSDMGEEP